MKREIFVEKFERDFCHNCKKYKKPFMGSRKKFEIVCQENMRLNAYILHPEIILNFIDVKANSCSTFRREFK